MLNRLRQAYARLTAPKPSPGLQVFSVRGAQFAIPPDDWMLQSIVQSGGYESHVLSAFLETVKPGSTVLDVGANVGVFAVLAARKAQRVIAVEASAENCRIVAINAALNNLTNVQAFPFAASDRIGSTTFDVGGGTNHTVGPQIVSIETANAFAVTCALPLDLLFGDEPIDVLKLDIEGGEYAALKGSERILSRKPIIFMEYSPKLAAHVCGVSGQDLLSLVFGRGYQTTILHHDKPREFVGQDQAAIDGCLGSLNHLDLMMVSRG